MGKESIFENLIYRLKKQGFQKLKYTSGDLNLFYKYGFYLSFHTIVIQTNKKITMTNLVLISSQSPWLRVFSLIH